MSFSKNTTAFAALSAQLNGDPRPLAQVSYTERFQNSRDTVAALLADGQLVPQVASILNTLIDNVEALFTSLQDSTVAPTSLDAQYVDSLFANLGQVLQGLYESSKGDSKSTIAQHYRQRIIMGGIEALMRQAGVGADLEAISAANGDDTQDTYRGSGMFPDGDEDDQEGLDALEAGILDTVGEQEKQS